ncbi:hypothetical protein G1K66_12330 [Tenacibaculum finnmarkense]|uniref:hypothetical protein n=1 Tax=Tenacibaculum finnmarkense TaxID=2781243 RepID=UPI001EFB35DB|nr:hypothetical protein [Tenacibaculum finnmarkense]MCG8814043.1 hypothetical protein [Tenacibaculum finnmarkense]
MSKEYSEFSESQYEIISEIIKSTILLGAKSDLTGTISSWGDTISDKEVLSCLKSWNEAESLRLKSILKPVVIDTDVLLSEFSKDSFFSESVDDLVKKKEGFQTLYTVSINGIHPEFNEFIVVPSFKEAEKLSYMLSKLIRFQ